MKKAFAAIIILLSCQLSGHASDKIVPDYEIVIYGNGESNSLRITEELDRKNLKYTYYDMLKKDMNKWGELNEKMKFYSEKKGMKASLPMIFVNGHIIIKKNIFISDIIPYLDKKNPGSPVFNQDRIGLTGIVVSSINPFCHDVISTDGLFYMTFKMERENEPYFFISDSKGEKLSMKKWHLSSSNYTYDDNNFMLQEKKGGTYKIWLRFPKADTYTCELYAKHDREYTECAIKYMIDVKSGMEEKDFYTSICRYGFDKNDSGLATELLKKAKDLGGLTNKFLEIGLSPDYEDIDGNTLLSYAVKSNDIELVKSLIKKGADLNHKKPDGTTILSYSCYVENKYEFMRMLKLLTDNGADINARGYCGQTLFYSFINGLKESDSKIEIVKYLISLGAEINYGDIDGITPMNAAKNNKNKAVYEYLKSIGGRMFEFQIPAENNTPLFEAVNNKDIPAIKIFKKEDFTKINLRTADGIPSTALHVAAEQGDIDVIKALCGMNVDWNTPDRYERTPLLIAVMNGHKEITGVLLKNNADPDKGDIRGMSPYAYAAVKNPDMMDELLKSGVKPKNDDPLAIAVMAGNTEMVKKLLKLYDKKNDPGLIEYAAEFGQVELAEYLYGITGGTKEPAKDPAVKAGYNQKRFLEYETRLLPVPPKKTGDISAKKGMFQFVLEEWSQYTEEKTDLDLKKLPVHVYVPGDYSEDKPYGLMVFLSWNYPGEAYRKILDKHNIIWAGFNCYNIEYKPLAGDRRHEIFYLAAVHNMQKYFNIDRSRIYLAGMSWGGRLTGRIIVKYPDVFKGGISMGGCQPDYVWNSERNEFHPSLSYAQKNMRLVISAGDYDFNRDEAFYMYNYLITRNFRNVIYFQEAGKYHEALSAVNFEKALDFLRQGTK